jgi:hypothetical protein
MGIVAWLTLQGHRACRAMRGPLVPQAALGRLDRKVFLEASFVKFRRCRCRRSRGAAGSGWTRWSSGPSWTARCCECIWPPAFVLDTTHAKVLLGSRVCKETLVLQALKASRVLLVGL